MKIGILQTGHVPDVLVKQNGNYDQIFSNFLGGNGFEIETWPVVDMVFPPNAEAADGWLITGSRFGVYEDHRWIAPLEQLIRDIHARRAPLIGVCFGHQIIAQALGGKVEKFADGWAVGRTNYDMGDKTLTVNAWHQDQVIEPPKEAKVLGGNAFCENAVLAYGDTIWTLQPHPEFTAQYLDGLLKTRGPGLVPDDLLAQATHTLNEPNSNDDIAAFMVAFFKKERA
ncbi:MAG: GMP synthase-like glutamine amidotransferase [Paracoccaceae bacterium]|jgi:GMP synthase-like glutamine amidotransferase